MDLNHMPKAKAGTKNYLQTDILGRSGMLIHFHTPPLKLGMQWGQQSVRYIRAGDITGVTNYDNTTHGFLRTK